MSKLSPKEIKALEDAHPGCCFSENAADAADLPDDIARRIPEIEDSGPDGAIRLEFNTLQEERAWQSNPTGQETLIRAAWADIPAVLIAPRRIIEKWERPIQAIYEGLLDRRHCRIAATCAVVRLLQVVEGKPCKHLSPKQQVMFHWICLNGPKETHEIANHFGMKDQTFSKRHAGPLREAGIRNCKQGYYHPARFWPTANPE